MNQSNYVKTRYNTPFIAQRADPYVLREGGQWYFTASVPAYDCIALRRAGTLESGLYYRPLRLPEQAEEFAAFVEEITARWASEQNIPVQTHVFPSAESFRFRYAIFRCRGSYILSI